MRIHTTTKECQEGNSTTPPSDGAAARLTRRPQLVSRSGRLHSWKTSLFESLGRELHALHRQQQERAFMATSHGLNYRETAAPVGTLH